MPKFPKSLFEYQVSTVRAYTDRFSERATHIARSGDARHFQGGPSTHRGTTCPKCSRRYSKVWDIDLTDPVLPQEFAKQFPSLTRLPLYICWTCVASTYRVISDKTIQTDEYRWIEVLKADESPYHDVPNEAELVPFSLSPVPTCVDALRCHRGPYDDCDEEASTMLQRFYDSIGVENFSTLGAFLLPAWGHHPKVCPNKKCPASDFESPELSKSYRRYMMKELALIDGDGNRHVSEQGLWLQYHICCICSTIVAEHACS